MNKVQTTETLLALMGCFLRGASFDGELSGDGRREVYTLAAKHDVAHLAAVVLGRAGELPKGDPFLIAKQKAIYQYVQQDYERGRIYEMFQMQQIPYIPLKGSVINGLYPEPWQRIGCDLDVLVRREDLDRAKQALQNKLGYVYHKTSEHDVSLTAPSGVHLELHYDLHEEEITVEEVWESARPAGEGAMEHIMTPELFLLHHIAHMAKHFRYGGCGLRPFLDFRILSEKMAYDSGKQDELLRERGLKEFFDVVLALTGLWFDGGASTPLLEAATGYILPAGVYGSMKNRVAVGQIREGNKGRYFMTRLFQSRQALEYPYPVLRKKGWLLPFCQVHRWYKLLADGKWKRITGELNANSTMDDEYRKGVEVLLKELRL